MDTNLKKSKKVRAFLYRVIAMGALCTMLFSALLGREAFTNLYKEGWGTLTGDIYYLTEFREYIADLYIYGMANIRLGDDQGHPYPADDGNVKRLHEKYSTSFRAEVEKQDDALLYYVEDTQMNKIYISGNITYPLFSEYDGHLLVPDDAKVCCYWNGSEGNLTFFSSRYNSATKIPQGYCSLPYRPSVEEASNARLVLALQETDLYSSELFSSMAETAGSYQKTLIAFFVSLGLFLVSSLCCLFSGKAAREMRSDYIAFSGKIWLEAKLGVLLAALLLCGCHNLFRFSQPLEVRLEPVIYNGDLSAYDFLWAYFLLGGLVFLLYTDLRRNGTAILKSSLTCKCICFIRDFINAQTWYRRTFTYSIVTFLCGILALLSGTGALILTLRMHRNVRPVPNIGNTIRKSYDYAQISDNSCVALSTTGLAILCLAGVILLLLGILLFITALRLRRFAQDTYHLTEKLSQLREGRLCEPLQLPKASLLTQAAQDLNAVENGIENAVEQKNRSNKMRVELITNVSHDLKTPLTSIINYADLLCEEKLQEPAAEYAAALQAKAYRLKSMVQDVFELSKATSGNLPVEITLLDLVKLIRQTLADMDERIQESNLTFKLNITHEPLLIRADGEKLYRVFQNLFINALQYSLDNSRVHIQLYQKDGQAYAKVKNISLHEMDFDPEEITERFVRADASRTTEGSGLGLSIAQSFTESCGGTFGIELDADMFTACVAFPLAETPASLSEEASHKEGSEKEAFE